MPSRKVEIHALNITRYEFPEVDLDVMCGSGTYIRTLGIDLAVNAGSTAVMSFLSRTGVGPFVIENVCQWTCFGKRHSMPSAIALSGGTRPAPNRSHRRRCTKTGHGLCLNEAEFIDPDRMIDQMSRRRLQSLQTASYVLSCVLNVANGAHRVFPTFSASS